jgi:hypothetical protein
MAEPLRQMNWDFRYKNQDFAFLAARVGVGRRKGKENIKTCLKISKEKGDMIETQ